MTRNNTFVGDFGFRNLFLRFVLYFGDDSKVKMIFTVFLLNKIIKHGRSDCLCMYMYNSVYTIET